MDKIREQGVSPKNGVKLGNVQKTVGVTKENLLILMEPTHSKKGIKVSFKYTVETPEEYTELLVFLNEQGIEDLTIRLPNGKIIENPKEAVGQDTFIFHDKGIISLLSDLYQKNAQANVIQKGNATFISKTIH